MAKIDLHVHSCFSARPSEWFLQRLGTRESYTQPAHIYRMAKRQQMHFITLTDHNEIEGSLQLNARYPDTTFTGVETTAYFPDGCKVHILVWGLTRIQFDMINRIRTDIYQLRDYLLHERLACAVAHATFGINKKLTLEHIERLLLLFDHFEIINGSRTRQANSALSDALSALTPDTIATLYRRYRIEPFSTTPWIKGLTAGTDDHSGLFIGKTYTEAEAATPAEFLEQLRLKKTAARGRHNDFRGLAFAIYKIAYDYMKSRHDSISSSLFGAINQYIFDDKSLPLKSRMKVRRMRYGKRCQIQKQIVELIDLCKEKTAEGIEQKIVLAYDKIARITDLLVQTFVSGLSKDVTLGDIPALIRRISGIIPAVFMSLPFFTTMNVLHESRPLLTDLRERFAGQSRWGGKIIYFTDTAYSAKLPAIPGIDHLLPGSTVITASCHDPEHGQIYEHIKLPTVFTFTASWLKNAMITFPSILLSLKIICEADPDEIIVASPGPVGMVGVFASRLLHVRSIGLHLDRYATSLRRALGDDPLVSYSATYLRCFSAMIDTVIDVSSTPNYDSITAA